MPVVHKINQGIGQKTKQNKTKQNKTKHPTGLVKTAQCASLEVFRTQEDKTRRQVQLRVHVACPTVRQGPELGSMLCYHCLEILNDCQIKGPLMFPLN